MAEKRKKRRLLKRLLQRILTSRKPVPQTALPSDDPAFRAEAVIGTLCISMVKNEQDIIEPFLRHNRAYFDLMVVLDNGSTDRTRDIVLSVARELGGIVVTDLPERGYDQARFMTQALRFVQGAVFADAACFLDADEFISAPDRAAFDAAVARVHVGQVGLMPWRTFLPDPAISEDDQPDPLVRMTFRRAVERPAYHKVLLRLGGQVDPRLTLDQGNHMARGADGLPMPAVMLEDLPLWHFPVRSSAQLSTKGVVGWIAEQARSSRVGASQEGQNHAYQWRRINDIVSAGKTAFSPAELADEALGYAQTGAPVPWDEAVLRESHGIALTRRCSDGRYGDPTALIAAARDPEPMAGQRFSLPEPPTRDDLAPGIENAFKGAWHWEFLFLDAPPILHMMERHRPASVLDIGCGNGAYPLLYRAYGATDVLGLDGIEPETTVLGPDAYRKVDLQQPQDVGRSFDLVVCLEVVEHIRPDDTATLIDTIERHALDLILFSMAEPGQPGNGHINCRGIGEVLDLWAARGWQPDLSETLAVRALSTMSWFRRNLLVLRRSTATGETDAGEKLRRIGAMPYRWYEQKAGLRMAAFSETYPAPPYSYGIRR